MFKPVIKWSGSKRTQAHEIIRYLPTHFNTYYEPFIGGGSMLYAINPDRGVCGDICMPLNIREFFLFFVIRRFERLFG